MKASDNVFPKLLVSEGAAPATPAAGTVAIYAKPDGLLYRKDDTGAEEVFAGGNMAGPAGSTDNAVPRFDGVTGKALQGSGVVISDANELSGYAANINAQVGAAYTLQASDAGKIVELTNGAEITLTLPNSLLKGFCCTVVQGGAGAVAFTAELGGSCVNRSGHTKSAGANGWCGLYVRSNAGTNAVWVLGGDTAA